MALSDTDLHGTFKFGVQSADAPTLTGFTAHTREPKYSPEVLKTAEGGEGQVLAVAVTKAAKRKIEGTLTGYVDKDTWDATQVPNNLSFASRFFIVGPISEPRKRGDFWEVGIELMSWINVTS